MSNGRNDTGNETSTKPKLKVPQKYKVVILNDDFTPITFVTALLMRMFHRTVEEAEGIANEIHTKGRGIANIYPLDVAQTKKLELEALAQKAEFPLKCEIEPE